MRYLAIVFAVLCLVVPAQASQFVAIGQRVSLKISGNTATLSYDGKSLTASGAINARHPSPTKPQVKFKVKYGDKKSGVCLRTQVKVPMQVKVCRASDGTYWAVQRWQRIVNGHKELHLSHWTGPQAKFEDIKWDTNFGHPRLCGRYTYRGHGIYGFKSTPLGVPLDSYGRNVFIDAYNSDIGPGWQRVLSLLANRPDGRWCWLFVERDGKIGYPAEKWRVRAIGPGVVPIAEQVILPPVADA